MTTLTVASVKADHAEIANALIAEGKEPARRKPRPRTRRP
jgi:hypothetical protein